MKISKKISYIEIAFYFIAITAFTFAMLMLFLVAFSDVLTLPKEEALNYILDDTLLNSFTRNINQ